MIPKIVTNIKVIIKSSILKFIVLLTLLSLPIAAKAQLNTDRVMNIGRNALYFEDYILAIQYFNQIIKIKPYMAEPYYLRAAAKLNLGDYKGAEADCSISLDYNPFILDAYQIRGIARQNMGDYKGAISDYDKGLDSSPESRVFLNNKAIAQVQDKDYEAADSTYNKLIRLFPTNYSAVISRAQFNMERKDTLQALADVNRAIEIDNYSALAYAMRGVLRMQVNQSDTMAIVDMNRAIELDPKDLNFYVNRAIMRYNNNDLRGSMEDYNHVVEKDPLNKIALYNRGLLRSHVGEYNGAQEDFTSVINLTPNNYFALYNRAIINSNLGNYQQAVDDYTRVLERYPSFVSAYYARSEIKRNMGDVSGGKADYNKAKQLMAIAQSGGDDYDEEEDEKIRKESDENINKFDRLLVADSNGLESNYDSGIRGRIQDKSQDIKILPQYTLTYYKEDEEINLPTKYISELDNINRMNVLPQKLYLTNSEEQLDSIKIARHFASIDTNTRLIDINPQNPTPYLSRAIDQMLIQDYDAAIDDLTAIAPVAENFMLVYFMRAVIRYRYLQAKHTGNYIGFSGDPASMRASTPSDLEYEMVLRDYDRVIALSPTFPYAYFNRGNIRCEQGDFTAAIVDYTKAIKAYPDFAEAYLNRGLVYIYMGRNSDAEHDLSKAGELGIVSAYNIIKRIKD